NENPAECRFCLECGQALAQQCPECKASIPPRAKFCGSCGSPLPEAAPQTAPTGVAAPSSLTGAVGGPSVQMGTELRLVSVLFCDLVGFTPLSEARDPEEVRELLTGYFDLARGIVARYGGVVEKFIGDAVMAVWGVPQ